MIPVRTSSSTAKVRTTSALHELKTVMDLIGCFDASSSIAGVASESAADTLIAFRGKSIKRDKLS